MKEPLHMKESNARRPWTSTLSRLAMALFAAALCAGCGSGKSNGASGDAGAEGGSSLGTPPLVTDPDATAMAISLSLVMDSSGTTPAAGNTVTLMFEPPNLAHLLALDTNTYASLEYDGTYTMSATSLTVSFKASGFDRGGTISFDPTKSTLTLPFQVFSADAGTSTWNRDVAFVAQNVQDLFEALSAATPLTLSLEERSARVLAYAQRYAVVHADVAAQALRQGATAPQTEAFWFLDPFIQGTYLSPDGTEIIFDYSDGSQGTAILYLTEPRGTTTLVESPLATDPRLALSVTPASDNANPPGPSKAAVLIAPFDSQRYYAHYPLGISSDAEGTTTGFGTAYNLEDSQSELESAGYHVTAIKNDDVTVPAIVNALSGPTPGYVLFATHGGSQGNIATGMFLNFGEGGMSAALQPVYAMLRGQGLSSLLDYKSLHPGTRTPLTLDYMCVPRQLGSTQKSACFLALTPYFFQWLVAVKGASFGNSLVFMDACLTDHNPDLRNAIAARAYFDFTISIPVGFGGAASQYFVKSLVRHTHSAEESYYNVLRVVNSAQWVYPEDQLFQNVTNFNVTTGVDVQGAFQGYFASGGTMMSYQKNGWLDQPAGGDAGASAMANPGYIWLLLEAGRWGGDAAQGADNLSNCWAGPWSMGTTGDLSTWCGMAAPGQAPKLGEVAYATYLLTGKNGWKSVPAASKLVTRWTLNDPAP
jgi:hypothetical protein